MASIPLATPAATTAPAPTVETSPVKKASGFSFNSMGHFFATFLSKGEAVLKKIEGTEATVEAVTAGVLAGQPVYGPLALTVEKSAYALLGEFAAIFTAGDAAAKAKLADAGLDTKVIETVQAVVASVPHLAATAKAL